MLKAVIFDLDGTLLDTIEDISISCNYVLGHYNKTPLSIEEYKNVVGLGAAQLFRDLLPTLSKSEQKDAFALFEKHYAKQFNKNTKMYENINKMLTFFQVRGIKMAVLSNKPNFFTKKCVMKYLRNWKFDAVYGIRDGIARKPDPSGAFEILKELHVEPSECLFVGDMKIDMITANNANITSIGVLWGFRGREELIDHGAKYIVKDPIEIIKLVNLMERN